MERYSDLSKSFEYYDNKRVEVRGNLMTHSDDLSKAVGAACQNLGEAIRRTGDCPYTAQLAPAHAGNDADLEPGDRTNL